MRRRPEHRPALGLALALALLAGCHSGSSAPATTPSPSATSTPAATPSPAAQLQQLAAAGAGRRFHATYAVHQNHPSSSATWVVWRTPSALRVDVVTGRVTTTLIRTPKATYSCRKARSRRTCFRVARAGKPIPTPFRLLAERLFSADVMALAKRTSAFAVSSAAGGSAAGSCFQVTPRGRASAQSVGKAVYCFNDAGILTAIRYPNGNLVRLRHAVVKAPQHQAFVPYSSPTPLPS